MMAIMPPASAQAPATRPSGATPKMALTAPSNSPIKPTAAPGSILLSTNRQSTILMVESSGRCSNSQPTFVKTGVNPTLSDQIGVLAVLDQAPVGQHQDQVGSLGGGQPVGNGDRCATPRQALQGPGEPHFGGRIDR